MIRLRASDLVMRPTSPDLLDPNYNRSQLVQWSWTVHGKVAVGISQRLRITDSPQVTMRPTKLLMNLSAEGLFFLTRFMVGNRLLLQGPQDAAYYGKVASCGSATCAHCGAPSRGSACRYCGTLPVLDIKAYGQLLRDCPTVRPSERVMFELDYTGRIPTGYSLGEEFGLLITLDGMALAL